jgi:hypothetical protein
LWAGCGHLKEQIPRAPGEPVYTKVAELQFTTDRIANTLGVSNPSSASAVDNPVFLPTEKQAPPAEYVQPAINDYYYKLALGKNAYLSTGSIVQNGAAYLYAKNVTFQLIGGVANEQFYCTTGIATNDADIPAGALSFTGNVVKGRAAVGDVPSALSGVTVSVDRSSNRVSLSFTLITDRDSYLPVTGVGTINPATGRFAGQLTGQGADNDFQGALYGPTGSELGVAVSGKSATAAGQVLGYTFVAAARR